MNLCPCGCGRLARTKKGYAGRGCYLRSIERDARIARTKAWAATPEGRAVLVRAGALGGKKTRATHWDDLLAQWGEIARTKGPSFALKTAYWRGYHTGYNKKRPYRKKAA